MRRTATALALSLLVAGPIAACGDDDESTTTTSVGDAAPIADITIEDAWARIASGDLGAAYLTITNEGDEAVRLIAASSPSADSVEIHETTMADDGTMEMVEQPDGFEIPPGGELVLEPGGKHLMLMGFTPGDAATIELTLDFDGTSVTVEAPIDAESSADMTGTADEHDHGDDAAMTGSDHGSGDLEDMLTGLDIPALHGIDDDISAGTFDPATQQPVAQRALEHLRATDWPVDVDVSGLETALADLVAALDAGDAVAAGEAATLVHELAHDLEPHAH